jgi:hypothetical protein
MLYINADVMIENAVERSFRARKPAPLALALAALFPFAQWLNFRPLNAEDPDKISAV